MAQIEREGEDPEDSHCICLCHDLDLDWVATNHISIDDRFFTGEMDVPDEMLREFESYGDVIEEDEDEEDEYVPNESEMHQDDD